MDGFIRYFRKQCLKFDEVIVGARDAIEHAMVKELAAWGRLTSAR